MIKDGNLHCDRCKKAIIEDTAYAVVGASIVMYDPNIKKPPVFSCIEQMHNYAQKLILCPQCWIDTLAEHGIELYDMNKVAKGYKVLRKRKGLRSFKASWNWFSKFIKNFGQKLPEAKIKKKE